MVSYEDVRQALNAQGHNVVEIMPNGEAVAPGATPAQMAEIQTAVANFKAQQATRKQTAIAAFVTLRDLRDTFNAGTATPAQAFQAIDTMLDALIPIIRYLAGDDQ